MWRHELKELLQNISSMPFALCGMVFGAAIAVELAFRPILYAIFLCGGAILGVVIHDTLLCRKEKRKTK